MLSVEKQMLFLLSKTDQMQTQELIRIYEQRGYSAPYIRNGLSRLKKDRYVETPSRSTYIITESGRAFIRSINRKPELSNQRWDGRWHFILLSFPESERGRRDGLRTDLLQTGFGMLYNGVYVSPWPYREELAELLDKHDAGEYVTVVTGAVEHGDITAEKAWTIWPLEETAQCYVRKRAWYVEQYVPLFNEALARLHEAVRTDNAGLELFLLYLQLGEQINELFLLDPMLPPALLPAEWIGRETLKLLTDGLIRVRESIPSGSEYAKFAIV